MVLSLTDQPSGASREADQQPSQHETKDENQNVCLKAMCCGFSKSTKIEKTEHIPTTGVLLRCSSL